VTSFDTDLSALERLTNDPLAMCDPATLQASHNVISSPASACGHTYCVSPGGPMIGPCGPAHVPVNLSARQAKAAGLLTSCTYGRIGIGSFLNADLGSSLVNRLRAKTDLLGSTLFRLTWKERITPGGLAISALRASARRTSDNDFIGWPTTQSRDGSHGGGSPARAMGETRHGSNLDDFAMLAAWGTPKVSTGDYQRTPDGRICLNLSGQVNLSTWPTPTKGNADGSQMARVRARPDGSKATVSLNQVADFASWQARRAQNGNNEAGKTVVLCSWATPTTRDWKNGTASASTITHVPTGFNLGGLVWDSPNAALAVLLQCDPTFAAWAFANGEKDDVATRACYAKFRAVP
jgi:hypothetical protein